MPGIQKRIQRIQIQLQYKIIWIQIQERIQEDSVSLWIQKTGRKQHESTTCKFMSLRGLHSYFLKGVATKAKFLFLRVLQRSLHMYGPLLITFIEMP